MARAARRDARQIHDDSRRNLASGIDHVIVPIHQGLRRIRQALRHGLCGLASEERSRSYESESPVVFLSAFHSRQIDQESQWRRNLSLSGPDPTFTVWAYLLELPAAAMAELGNILPEPGDEEIRRTNLPEQGRRRLGAIGIAARIPSGKRITTLTSDMASKPMPTMPEAIEQAKVEDQQKGNSLRRNGFRIAAALCKKNERQAGHSKPLQGFRPGPE